MWRKACQPNCSSPAFFAAGTMWSCCMPFRLSGLSPAENGEAHTQSVSLLNRLCSKSYPMSFCRYRPPTGHSCRATLFRNDQAPARSGKQPTEQAPVRAFSLAERRHSLPGIWQVFSAGDAELEGLVANRHNPAKVAVMAGKEPTEHAHMRPHICER